MEEYISEIVLVILFFLALLASPFILILTIQTIVTYVQTCKWQKQKLEQSQAESANLVSAAADEADTDSELDPDDSGDEAELQEREEKRRDLAMTFEQKFRKEWARAFKGDKEYHQRQQKLKERNERRKLAKEMAREMIKMERRKQKKANGSDGDAKRLEEGLKGMEVSLPSYHSAMSEGS